MVPVIGFPQIALNYSGVCLTVKQWQDCVSVEPQVGHLFSSIYCLLVKRKHGLTANLRVPLGLCVDTRPHPSACEATPQGVWAYKALPLSL